MKVISHPKAPFGSREKERASITCRQLNYASKQLSFTLSYSLGFLGNQTEGEPSIDLKNKMPYHQIKSSKSDREQQIGNKQLEFKREKEKCLEFYPERLGISETWNFVGVFYEESRAEMEGGLTKLPLQ